MTTLSRRFPDLRLDRRASHAIPRMFLYTNFEEGGMADRIKSNADTRVKTAKRVESNSD